MPSSLHVRVLVVAAASMLVACNTQTPSTDRPAQPAPSAAAPVGLVAATVAVPRAEWRTGVFDTPRQALVPPGWTISRWAQMDSPRLIAFAPDGAMVVSQPGDGKVARVTKGADGAADATTLLDGLDAPHGLAFAGDTLYVAETDQVDAYRYRDGKAVDRRVVAAKLPSELSPELGGKYAHTLKSVAVGPDGAVYFSIGSTGNISEGDRTATPPRATIMRIPPGGGADGRYDVFATGVRNGTGLAIAPDGAVWTAVNNRDQVQYPYDKPYAGAAGSSRGRVIQQYVNDHPLELLAKLSPGRELGWPYCNPDGDNEPGEAGTRQRTSDVGYINDWQTNADGKKLDCAALPPVEQTLGGHSAPLGLSFVDGQLPAPYANGALVGVHGSWNAAPPRAPEVAFFASEGTGLQPQQTLVGGFQGPDGSRWGRPVSAVVGPDGAVYISDDGNGSIYRLAPPGR